jgi:hypothetical protein
MQMLSGIEGFSLALFTRVLRWNMDEIHVLLAHVRKEMKNPNIHTQYHL